jgi:TolB-like protein
MARKTNDIEKFWHELKRRKTGKVIIAYAATAFILLQLADLLTPALLLPEWTTRLVTLILIVGFPIAIIFSWVFDITPEGIKKTESVEESENKEIVTKLVKRIFHVSNIIIGSLIIVVGILAYPKVFKPNTLENLRAKGRISIAVMPFQNMTNDTTWNVWQDGIQNELITSLTNSEELKVRQIESITGLLRSKGLTNYASITPSFASNISRKLDANAVISGTIKRAGATIRVNAQLIDPKSEEVFKTFQIDGTSENEILSIIDSLSIRIKDFLLISGLEKKLGQDAPMFITTKSSEAFRYYLNGYQALYKLDCPTAINWFLMALKIDSTFVHAMSLISYSYGLQDLYIEAKDWALKAHEFKNRVPISQQLSIDLNYATYFETPNEEIKYEKQLLELDNQLPFTYYRLGYSYNNLFQFKKAIPEFQKSLEIYKRWGTKPRWIYNYIMLGLAYHKIEQFSKENKIYAKTEHDFPNDLLLIVPDYSGQTEPPFRLKLSHPF